MRPSRSLCVRVTTVLGIMAVAGVLISVPAFGAAQPPQAAVPSTRPAGQPAIAANREAWQAAMKRLPVPKEGCFKSSFPRVEWKEVTCAHPPAYPFPRQGQPLPQTVGNGVDFSARVTGSISGAEGSFDSVTGVTSETGQVGGAGGQVADAYSLQLNSNFFNSSVCSGAANPPSCQGWAQAVLSNATLHGLFLEYWLINWGNPCPAGWNAYSSDCFVNTPLVPTPSEPIAILGSMTLTMDAASGGLDTITLWDGTNAYATSYSDSAVNLSAGWTDAEFNIIGDCCSASANFNAGSTTVVRTTVHNGTMNAPLCELEGFTGETNNLTLVGTPAVGPGASPAIVFTQSNIPGTPGSCAAASGVGDVHLTTLNGTYYNFQAAGDFEQLADGNDFEVQTRQVSGAPTWPDATVNKEVGARFGSTRIAVCQAPMRIEINGAVTQINSGQTLTLADGTSVWRNGNVYSARGVSGDSIRADVVNPYINLTVGLGHPQSAATRGLLANPNGNPNQIATSTGAVLNEPVSFETLYNVYGDSWRVPRKESLMCGGEKIEKGNPKSPFYTVNLDPKLLQHATAICDDAGVKILALLESCVLDVAVLGKKSAAKVYVGMPAPVVVYQARTPCRLTVYHSCPGDD
jgi:hypothetical protein